MKSVFDEIPGYMQFTPKLHMGITDANLAYREKPV